MSDLFDAAAEERRQSRAPLAARMRPTTLDDVVGQEHLLGAGRPLRSLIEADKLSSLILWGPPGTGTPSRKPWASGQRSAARNARWASVSTPSATALRPSARASCTASSSTA